MLQRPYKQGRGILWMNNTGGSGTERQRGLAKIYIYFIQSHDNSHGFILHSANEGFELQLRNEFLNFQAFKQTNLHDESKHHKDCRAHLCQLLRQQREKVYMTNVHISVLHKYRNYGRAFLK